MKKYSLVPLLLLLVSAGQASAQIGIDLRILGRYGLTLDAPTLRDLAYTDYLADFHEMNASLYGGGVQALSKHKLLRFGVDIGFMQLFHSNTEGTEYAGTDSAVHFIYEDEDRALNASVFVEISPLRWILFQAGLGAYYVHERYTEVENDSLLPGFEEWDPTVGFFIAAGFNIPISRRISIPILVRADFVYRYDLMVPFFATAGLEIKL